MNERELLIGTPDGDILVVILNRFSGWNLKRLLQRIAQERAEPIALLDDNENAVTYAEPSWEN